MAHLVYAWPMLQRRDEIADMKRALTATSFTLGQHDVQYRCV